MKNLLLVCSLAAAVTGCHTQKRSTASADPDPPARRSTRVDHAAFKSTTDNSPMPPKVERSCASSGISSETEGLGALQIKYAILLDVPAEQLTNAHQLEFIESWYGTRYKYGGTDKSGVDCSGFVQVYMSTIYGIDLPRTSSEQYEETKHVKRSQLQEGDLVFFHTIKRSVSHVGVYLRNNKFVHASTSSGVTISDLEEEYYSTRFVAGGRVK